MLTTTSGWAADHVMAATHSRSTQPVPSSLSLSLKEAQDYALEQNRSLRNASLEVQEAYAARWQTIASMLPQADLNANYTTQFKHHMAFGPMDVSMPNTAALGITASVGINAQGIVGALMQNVAISVKKITLDQSRKELEGSVQTSYVSLLALQSITNLLDSTMHNMEQLQRMTERSVEVGAAEQTQADQIRVRVNAMRNQISMQNRNIDLAKAALKVLLDVPVTTEITLTQSLEELLSAEEILKLISDNYNIENNHNYQLLKEQTKLAKLQVHQAGWAYGPTLSAAYQYQKQKRYVEDGQQDLNMTVPNVVQIGISMPLWSSAKRAAGVVEKKIAYERSKNTLSEMKDNLDIQNQQLRYELASKYESYVNDKDNLEVTDRVFRSMANKFRFGAASNLELINASNDVISAQSTYIQAVLELVNAQVELETFLNNE